MSPTRALPLALLFICVLSWSGRADDPGVQAIHPKTLAEVGRTRMVPFRLAAPVAADTSFPVASSAPDILEALGAAEVLSGHALGHARVRGIRPGSAVLTIGGTSIDVRVVPPRVDPPEDHAPRIVTPTPGAVVWGDILVAVEVDEAALASPARVLLRLPGGRTLSPRDAGDPVWGPTRRALFDLDLAALGAGPLELVPVAALRDGTERTGPSVTVMAISPQPEEIAVFEAEDPPEGPRLERFGTETPPVGVDPQASGSQYAGNWGSDPAVCVPFEAREAGRWQVLVRGRGDPAGGAFPTVGILVDDGGEPVTSGVLADARWHRVPVGVPFRLEAGKHTLTPYFLNDFYAAMLADRNLYLDRIEVVRVDAPGAATMPVLGAGNGMGMTGASGSMGMGMGGGAEAGAAFDPLETGQGKLRIALTQSLHGRSLLGGLAVHGWCTWPDPENSPPPRVTLVLNGRELGSQRAAAPQFWLDARDFAAGSNTVQLFAQLDSGTRVATEVHTVTRPDLAGATQPRSTPRAFRRFPMQDEGWDPTVKEHLSGDHDPPERRSAAYWSNGEAVLALPDDLSGSFDVLVEGRGDDFDGPPRAVVTLHAGGSATPVGAIEVHGWWDTRPVGTVLLPTGPKRLSVAFDNDKCVENVGDRNLWLQAVVLRESAASLDVPPLVRIAWPPAGQAVFSADAVVADAWVPGDLAWAELLLDGRSIGLAQDLTRRAGRIVFPLATHGLAPGTHALAVRASDVAGRVGDSPPVDFTVLESPPAAPSRHARALRLLDRFAYGPDPEELAAVLTMGEEAWLEDRLGRGGDDPGDRGPATFATALFPDRDGDYDAAGRVLGHAMSTGNPVRARFVRWVENHFSTWIRKIGADPKWREHVTFLRLGPAPFTDLLFASARSPAMLAYLDQQGSFARQLNENYAREIMELHSLGVHGGYTQADVTELAKLLTGWTFSEEGDGGPGGPRRRTFRFDPALNDGAPRRVFGLAFAKAGPGERYDRAVRALEMLAAHPSTARFVCRKLAEHYVALPAPDALVADLAGVFHESHGDLRAVLRAIAVHPLFHDPALPEKMCTPFDYSVRLARACGLWQPWGVIEFLQRSGTGVFDRPTPDGFPEEDVAYADTNALLQRWRFARQHGWALAGVVPPGWRWSEEPWTDEGRQALVDVVALRLTGRMLGAASHRAALDVLKAAQGGRDEAVQLLAAFVAQLPEANVR